MKKDPSVYPQSPSPGLPPTAPSWLSFLGWNQISVASKNLSAPTGSTPGSQLQRQKNKQTFRAGAWPGQGVRGVEPPNGSPAATPCSSSLPVLGPTQIPGCFPVGRSSSQPLKEKFQDGTPPNSASRQAARLGARREVWGGRSTIFLGSQRVLPPFPENSAGDKHRLGPGAGHRGQREAGD